MQWFIGGQIAIYKDFITESSDGIELFAKALMFLGLVRYIYSCS
jgi:hypothetical protein